MRMLHGIVASVGFGLVAAGALWAQQPEHGLGDVDVDVGVELGGQVDVEAVTPTQLEPAAAEMAAEVEQAFRPWPGFRGPDGQGHGEATGLPITWSERESVVWKTPIPHRGWSSPVVWGDQIWLTTATEDGHEMFIVCVSRETGQVLHQRELFYNEDPEPLENPVNSYASPTPVIEEGRVYVHFGSYGTAAIDTETFDTVWERRDLPSRHVHGPGASPVLFDDLLILAMDGADEQYVAALDKDTGETVWRTERSTDFGDVDADGNVIGEGDFRKAYATPIVIEHEGEVQLVSPAARSGYAYDPHTGEELWRVQYRGFSNASGTLYGEGLVFMNTGFGRPDLLAIAPDGRGDVTETHVQWAYNRGVPRTTSALLVDGLIYFVTDDAGVLTCIDAQTGEEVWKERVGGNYSASPIYADGRLYFFSEEGETLVIRPGREPEIIARNELGDGFMASPAVSGESLILRTRTHLYRIEGNDP